MGEEEGQVRGRKIIRPIPEFRSFSFWAPNSSMPLKILPNRAPGKMHRIRWRFFFSPKETNPRISGAKEKEGKGSGYIF